MRFVRKDWFWRAPVVGNGYAYLELNFSTLNFNRQFNHILNQAPYIQHI